MAAISVPPRLAARARRLRPASARPSDRALRASGQPVPGKFLARADQHRVVDVERIRRMTALLHVRASQASVARNTSRFSSRTLLAARLPAGEQEARQVGIGRHPAKVVAHDPADPPLGSGLPPEHLEVAALVVTQRLHVEGGCDSLACPRTSGRSSRRWPRTPAHVLHRRGIRPARCRRLRAASSISSRIRIVF